jgi:amidase
LGACIDGSKGLNMVDFTYATAIELAAAMAKREVSSVELTNAAIKQIERYDDRLNAICVCDFERALRAARDADNIRGSGGESALLGVPITVKESFNVAGLPTTWGIPPFSNFKPMEDAVAVLRAKAAGAVVLGKTNVPLGLGDLQTYNDIYGTTNNPWDISRTPGGSSGGSAAGLAAGYGALSIGSDIAGSLRVPAHFCGVYAHKPTFELLPGRGHTPPSVPPLPYERDLAVLGPMARDVKDLTLMLDLLAGPDDLTLGPAYRLAMPAARHDKLSNYRVLVLDTHPLMPTASSVRTAIEELAVEIARLGAKVKRTSPLLPDQVEAARLYMRLLMSSLSVSMPAEAYEAMRANAARLDANDLSLAAERVRGTVMSHRDWIIIDDARAKLRQRWREFFREFDVIVCPIAPTPAFPHDHSVDPWSRSILIDGHDYNYADQLIWAGMATAPGLPSTAIPLTQSASGLPIGVQVLGPMHEDRTTLHFSEILEQRFGGFRPPPAINSV